MKPSELLRAVRRRVTEPGRWTPSDLGFGNRNIHCGCVLTHANDVAIAGRSRHAYDVTVDALSAEQAIWGYDNPGDNVARFNDSQRSVWPIVAWLGRAVRRLEAEGR